MTIIITLKEPNPEWRGLNVKRFENIKGFYTSISGKLIIIDNHGTYNYSEFLSKIANILITP